MKRILVIQLFRIGDVLQTTPVLTGLRNQNPDSYIAVLVRKVFAEPLQNNQAVDEVITWDIDSFLFELFDKNIPLSENYNRVRTFIQNLHEKDFDTIINLTNDFTSALITYALGNSQAGMPVPPKEVIGLTYRRDGSSEIKGEWINYLFLVPENRRYNRYNLVDIFANACGIKEDARALSFPTKREDDNFATTFLQEAGISGNKRLIGFQPGASKAFKRWPAEHFAELGDKLIRKHNAQIVLFGSPREANIGEEIQGRMNENVINAIGKTSLGQLAALLKHCDMLITNDTGTMHVAAAVGTRTLVLSFGSVSSYETGPYGNGHFILEPDTDCFPCSLSGPCNSLVCRDLLTVDAVLRAFEIAQSDYQPKVESSNDTTSDNNDETEHPLVNHSQARMPVPPVCQFEELNGLTLYRSSFDEKLGRLNLIPVNHSQARMPVPPPLRAEEILKEMYARFWERVCSITHRQDACATNSPNQRLIDYEITPLVGDMRNYIRDFKAIEILADKGLSLARQIISTGDTAGNNYHEIKSLARDLEQIEKRLEDAADVVKPLTSYFLNKVRMAPCLPLTATIAWHLKMFQNLKDYVQFFISNLALIESQTGRRDVEPTLSLCMIVKNEEKNLPACLESVKDAVDDIIVVDTGSYDRTISIAKEYGAKIYHYNWNDDFSAAKNESLRHATGDWILNLDADERLAAESRRLLRTLIWDKDAIAFDVNIHSSLETSPSPGVHIGKYPRLFRNLPGVRYEGKIHEQIIPSLRKLGGVIKDSKLVIEHLGYAINGEAKDKKYLRNLRLLQQQVDDEPDNAFAHYTLASMYNLMGDDEQVISHCERAIAIIKHDKTKSYDPIGVAKVYFLLAKKQIKKGLLDRAEQLLQESKSLSPRTPEIYSNLGVISVRRKEYKQALNYFSEASKLNPADNRIKRLLSGLVAKTDIKDRDSFSII